MSEQKTSTVKEVLSVREWTGQYGTTFFHKIELANGDIGDIGKKVSGGIKAGDSLTYTLESSEHGNRIKAVQPQGNGFGGGGRPAQSTASFALSYAKDIAIANMAKVDKPIDMEALAGKVIATASTFQKWMKENQ